jgi:hypothetical protein
VKYSCWSGVADEEGCGAVDVAAVVVVVVVVAPCKNGRADGRRDSAI